jgi:hypothetical protein
MATNTHLIVFEEIGGQQQEVAQIYLNSRNNVVINAQEFSIIEITKEDWPEIKGFIDANFKMLNDGEEAN